MTAIGDAVAAVQAAVDANAQVTDDVSRALTDLAAQVAAGGTALDAQALTDLAGRLDVSTEALKAAVTAAGADLPPVEPPV